MDSGSRKSAKQIRPADDAGSPEASQRRWISLPRIGSPSLDTLQKMQEKGTLPEGLELVRHDMSPPDSWVPGDGVFAQNEHRTKDGEALVKEFKHNIDHKKDKCLGNGASGSVYRYEEAKVGFVFAYKIIRIEGSDADLVSRYAREEYHALASLHDLEHPHPNIVTLLDQEESKPTVEPQSFTIFMEYCNGQSLKEYLKDMPKGTHPNLQDLVSIFFQINNALAFCHHGIFCDGNPGGDESMIARTLFKFKEDSLLHRDLKPANILLIKDPRITPFLIKVADFGHSVILQPSDGPAGVVNGPPSSQYRGTDLYRAPEINDPPKGKVEWTEQCDMFSLGCIMYELLHFTKPFNSIVTRKMPKVSVSKTVRKHYGDPHCILLDFIEDLLLVDGTKRPSSRRIHSLLYEASKQFSYRRLVEGSFLSNLWEVSQNQAGKSKCRRVQFNIESPVEMHPFRILRPKNCSTKRIFSWVFLVRIQCRSSTCASPWATGPRKVNLESVMWKRFGQSSTSRSLKLRMVSMSKS